MTKASTLAGLTEAIAGELKHHRSARMQVSMGETCECGYWSGEESPGKSRPPGFMGLEWHRGQVSAAVALAWLEGHGWGDGLAARVVLVDYEAELLELKGPCSFATCRLHYAHRGPCCTAPVETGDQK